MIIERSNDGGVTYNAYQYFAEDCVATYGMKPSESPPAENPLQVIIEHSKLVGQTYVHFANLIYVIFLISVMIGTSKP